MGRIIVDRATRTAPCNVTEAAVTCRPFASNGAARTSDGVMHNFSSDGSLIETTEKYRAGTVLIVRMVGSPHIPASIIEDIRPRSICLAEVRWHQQQVNENVARYRMGLKYLS